MGRVSQISTAVIVGAIGFVAAGCSCDECDDREYRTYRFEFTETDGNCGPFQMRRSPSVVAPSPMRTPCVLTTPLRAKTAIRFGTALSALVRQATRRT